MDARTWSPAAAEPRSVRDTLLRLAAAATGQAITVFARFLTGARATGAQPVARPTVYFANHASHADFVLLWATLPAPLRRRTRPVAAIDYWQGSALRRFIGSRVFGALLIRRDRHSPGPEPVAAMAAALARGESLIFFPEGTRNTGETALLPLRAGLHHLAQACPDARLVPVWLDNLGRVLPKGALVPLPLSCTPRHGAPLERQAGEGCDAFLARARAALLALRPAHDTETTPETA